MRILLITVVLLAATAPAAAAEVVFSSNRCVSDECRSRIRAIGDDGSRLRQITDPPPLGNEGQRIGNVADLQPAWSPLVARVVFTRSGGYGAQAAIYTAARDGGDVRRVSPEVPEGGELQENFPDWSPLGTLIAFESNRPVSGGAPGARRIWVSAPDGSLARPLTGDGWAHLPRFTPDGLHVMYSDLSDGSRVKSVPIAGGPPRPVIAGDLPIGPFALAASPDGRRLAVALNGPDGFGLHVVDAASGALEKVTDHGMAGASWSGDGRSLFSALPTGAFTFGLVRVRVGDGTATPLTDGRAADQSPDWGTTDALAAVRDRIGFAAIDPSGVRGARAAIARRSGSRCRFLVRGRLAAPSRCSRPRWFAAARWKRATRGLRPGRYRVWIRARDGAGNAPRRPRPVDLRLR